MLPRSVAACHKQEAKTGESRRPMHRLRFGLRAGRTSLVESFEPTIYKAQALKITLANTV